MKSIREYHEATKHSWEKLYQNRHSLDWANQPNPFRAYLDCPKVDMGSRFGKIDIPLSRICFQDNVGHRNEPISLVTLSTLLYYSLAISAWKSFPGMDPWSLRVNPSSGDLHPTETHVYVHDVKDVLPGAYHYFVKTHQLEQRVAGDIVPSLWQALGGASPTPPIIIQLNTIFWREAWKYQSRALRYCYLDLGHAMYSISVAAGGLGLFVAFIGGFHDSKIRRHLCFDKTDEHPLLFLAIDVKQPVIGRDQKEVENGTIGASTHINRLSGQEVNYPLIDKGHGLTCETVTNRLLIRSRESLPDASYVKIDATTPGIEYPLKWAIRHRRSATDFDGKTVLPGNVFCFLMHLLCSPYKADYLTLEGTPLIIPYLYIHRVEGLEKGVYRLDVTQKKLLLLSRGDMQRVAKELSLNQDIAGDSAFTVSFISNFDYAVQRYGNRGYRYIHYEAGFMGQSLYLGATATGFDATGIGAFIDDEVHAFLKTPPEQQVVYHFTVGKRVDDPRISTLPAYNQVHDREEDIQ